MYSIYLFSFEGEKPYSCEICGRRFTQKQNMTSHLTTHRKPKPDKSFRAHFSSEIEEYDNNEAGIISGEFSNNKPTVKNFRAFEQSKQLNAQTIGSNHYVLGDMQNIEVQTATESGEQQNVSLEHGLGLLSSVARKGESTDVQVDGIVNIPEGQFSGTSSNNADQVVEVLIRNSSEDKSNHSSTLTVQMPVSNSQNKIILDPSTQAVTDADGQEIPLDSNTANNLANILQNPDVLAAINNAASTNKLIVIGPVSMFDGSTSQSSSVVALSSTGDIDGNVSTTFSQEQLAQITALVQQEQSAAAQVSSQTVNDSISATSALAAVESYLQNDQPSSSISVKGDQVVGNILGSIQPDGKSGPSAIVQSAQANLAGARASNLTISMPPMAQSSISITHASMGITDNKLPMTSKALESTSSEEVTSSNDVNRENHGEVDNISSAEVVQSNIDEQLVIHQEPAESTTHPPGEYMIASHNDLGQVQFITADQAGVADSSDMVDTEASSSGEPVLLLSTDEHGQPQIIVKMPDGSETIMSDPALAESLIQVPTITNAGIEDNEAEAAAMVEQIPADDIQLQMPDQGVPNDEEPTQSDGMAHAQYASQSDQISGEIVQMPDQGLPVESTNDNDLSEGNVDSSGSVDLVESQTTQQSTVSNSTSIVVQTPDSSSSQQQQQQVISESQIDSRQGLYVMEHVSASDETSSSYPEQSNIDFAPDQEDSSEFQADSSSSGNTVEEGSVIVTESNVDGEQVDGNIVVEYRTENGTYLQMNDVSQSSSVNNQDIDTSVESATVSSTDCHE